MEGHDQQPRGVASQKMSIELLAFEMFPETAYTRNSGTRSVGKEAISRKAALQGASSSRSKISRIPAMAVHLDACIHCNRCMRACRENK
jgi:formate dehydrogenase major subunit